MTAFNLRSFAHPAKMALRWHSGTLGLVRVNDHKCLRRQQTTRSGDLQLLHENFDMYHYPMLIVRRSPAG